MNIIELIYTFFDNNTLVLVLSVSIVLGFIFRVYFMSSGTWEYSRETASKKLTGIILFMIILDFCYNANFLPINTEANSILSAFAVIIYLVIALLSSLNSSNLEKNTCISFLKFLFVFCFAISNNAVMLVLSFSGCIFLFFLRKRGFIREDGDKITYAEILLLCSENFVLSLVMLLLGKATAFSTIMTIVFEETVLYSINYIALFMVREKLYQL